MASTVTQTQIMSPMQDSEDRLMTDLKATDTLPLWAQMAKLNPPLPNPQWYVDFIIVFNQL